MKIAILGPQDPRNPFVEFVCSCGMAAIVVLDECSAMGFSTPVPPNLTTL